MTTPQPPAKRDDQSLAFDPAASTKLLQRGLTVLKSGDLALNKRPEILWRFHGYGAHPGSEQYRPHTLPVIPENIPQELKERDQWVAWDWVWEGHGYWRKQPLDAKNGCSASPADSWTWSPMAVALNFANRMRLPGIGFVLSAEDPYIGIDMDDCRDPATGEVDQATLDILSLIDSYAELSVSGTGVHIIAKGLIPERRGSSILPKNRGSRTRSSAKHRVDATWPEIYHSNQFFVITGHPYAVRNRPIDNCQAALDRLHSSLPPANANFVKESDISKALCHTAVSATSIFVSTWDGMLRRLSLDDGSEIWCTRIENILPELVGSPYFSVMQCGWLDLTGWKSGSALLNVDSGAPVPWWGGGELLGQRDAVIYAMSGQHQLVALDEHSGAELWMLPLHGKPRLLFDEGVVYVAHGRSLTAVSAQSGRRLWHFHLPADFEPVGIGFHYLGKEGHMLWADLLAGRGTSICVFDSLTGHWLWRASSGVSRNPVANSDSLLIYSIQHSAGLCAVDWQTGRTRWTADGPCVALHLDQEAGLMIAHNDGDELFALDLGTGAEQWRLQNIRCDVAWTSDEDGVLLVHPIVERQMHAIDVMSGTVLWSRPAWPEPKIAQGRVYAGTDDGGIHAVELRTGAEVWSVASEELIPRVVADVFAFPPVIDELHIVGNVLVVEIANSMVALRLPD